MKKLMILGLALAAGFAANAMALNWKYSGAAATEGSTVYMVLGDAAKTDWASAAAIKTASAALENDTGSGSVAHGTVTKSGAGSRATYVASGNAKDSDLNKSSNYYFVLLSADEKSYKVTSVYAGTNVYDPDNQESGSLLTVSGFGSAYTFGTTTTTPGPTPTPEPTSGLLLLLGVAGLALRRGRRA